jgi:hypothetical protein
MTMIQLINCLLADNVVVARIGVADVSLVAANVSLNTRP